MGVYFRYILFSLMLFSSFSYSDDYGDYPSGIHKSFGTHLAYYDTAIDYLGYFTVINGAVYLFKDGNISYINGYTANGAYLTGDWLVIDNESQAYAWGVGDIYSYYKSHPEVFNNCQQIKGRFSYKYGDVHWILDDPKHPDTSSQSQALIYDNCSYKVIYNDCPDNPTPDTFCNAYQMNLFSIKSPDDDSDDSDGSSDNINDSSDDSVSSDSSGFGISGGSDSSSGHAGSPVFPGGGSGVGSDTPSGDSGSGVGSDTPSGDSGSGVGSDAPSGDSGSGGVSDASSGSGSGSSSGMSSGGWGSGGGSGSLPGGNSSGGSSGSNTGATGDDDDGSNIFLPSLDIPELSLAPLWNIWPSARDFALELPSAKCPVWKFPLFGRIYYIDQFCTLFTSDLIAIIRVISLLTASVMSFIIVLRS